MSDITDSNKIDFLRFSAYSFKDMITRKFSENAQFTDLIYEGSNLTILIDLCAYLFLGMTYCLNAAAAESMFSDTQIYKNISRLVKLIGYNPKGFIPSTCLFLFTAPPNADDLIIPKYTAIDINKYDSLGNKIYYSLGKESHTISNGTNTLKLYNGKWYLYDTIFVASGEQYEIFILNNVVSNNILNEYAAHGFIDVYVLRNDTFMHFLGLTDEIFSNNLRSYDYDSNSEGVSIFKATDDDRYFSIRLNENKCYEIKFGNGTNGLKLEEGDLIYVFYMKSNGFDAMLNIGDIKNGLFIEPTSLLAISDNMFYTAMLNINNENIELIKEILSNTNDITNTSSSTTPIIEEDVNTIRNLAPLYYMLGNRLVSKYDYEYYIKNRYSENIIDVKCLNNWDYISTFYGWLYNLGLHGIWTQYNNIKGEKRATNPKYYINLSKLIKYDYFYADTADENNVYLWVKMQNNSSIWKSTIDADLNLIKVLTSEIVYVEPITVEFEICAAPILKALSYFNDELFDNNNESYLEITVSDNSLYSNTSIKTQINLIFIDFFNPIKLSIGNIININDIETLIYAIPGVLRIRTVFSCDELDEYGNKKYADIFIDGISFATWSSSIIDVGDDISVSTINRSLELFLFPHLYRNSIVNRIKIIKRSFSNNSTVLY